MKAPYKPSTFGLGEYTQHVVLDGNCGLVTTALDAKGAQAIAARLNAAPQIGAVYEFTNYDGQPATLKVVDVTESHVWYKWTEPTALHVYPMTLELWNQEEYKLA